MSKLSPSQVAQIEAVRKKVKEILSIQIRANPTKIDYSGKKPKQLYEILVSDRNYIVAEILSLPEIAILDPDQTVDDPSSIYEDTKDNYICGYIESQQDMLSAHFQRTIDKGNIGGK